ncbi:TPA: hypothetical protein TXL63_000322 [Streptococcus suis]|nr:hypothetical protein [Streptococcus suis]
MSATTCACASTSDFASAAVLGASIAVVSAAGVSVVAGFTSSASVGAEVAPIAVAIAAPVAMFLKVF